MADPAGSHGMGPPPFTGIIPQGSRAVAICVSGGILTLLTIVFTVFRILFKYQTKYAKFAIDDLLLFVAILLFIAENIMLWVGVDLGYGDHIQSIIAHHPKWLIKVLKIPLYEQAVSSIALCFAKLSVGATLLHLCRGVTYLDKRLALTYKILIIGAIVLAIVGNVITVILTLVGCDPGHSTSSICKTPPTMASYIALSANLVVNLILVLSTMWLLRKLKLASRDRLAIDLLLCFMFTASIVSIVKAVRIPQALLDPKEDLTWDVPVLSILQNAEVALSIWAACLPSVRNVLGQHFPSHWLWQRPPPEFPTETDTAPPCSQPLDSQESKLRVIAKCSTEITSLAQSDWAINRLEAGLKNSARSSSIDDISEDKHKLQSESSLEHCDSERCSTRCDSERRSERSSGLSWA